MDKKKTLILRLLAFFYILQPIGYIILLSIYNKIDPLRVIAALRFNNLQWIIWWVFFVTGPVVGFGLLYVKRWGWYIFVIHGFLVIVDNVFNLIKGGFNLEGIASLIFIIGGLGVLFYFIDKEIRSPFFNPATRWWDLEGHAKIEMDTLVTFTDQSIDGKIVDISRHGCFFKMEPVYNIGEEVSVLIDIEHELRGKLEGKIVWISRGLKKLPDGIGVKFSKKTKEEKEFITRIMSMLKDMKQKLKLKA